MPNRQPTDFEIEILQELWGKGPQTVRQVYETLSARRSLVYTSVLKAMQLMHEKGLVRRDESERSHVYEAAVDEQETKLGIVSNIIEQVFGGSAAGLAMHALNAKPSSSDDIQKIQEMLDSLEAVDEQPAPQKKKPKGGRSGG